ncbi:MAG: RNA methyltransferase [candidate division Zixibacteria bacterium]|nr:RNA methyltransferase [Candidatus Tariuqbacter arcticus]
MARLQKVTLSQIKLTASLKKKKYRRLESLSIAEGSKLAAEALKAGIPVHSVFFTAEAAEEHSGLVELIMQRQIAVFSCSPSDMVRMSWLKTPPGCLLVYKTDFQPPPREGGLLLGLYQISDPGNLGTIIRTADWFGVEKMLLSEDSAELHNPSVVRGSMGSAFHIPVETGVDLSSEVESLKRSGYKIAIAVTSSGRPPFPIDKKTALIMGDEMGKLPPEIEGLADIKFTIPRKGCGESLNLAAACSILLYVLTGKTNIIKD